MKLYYFFRFHYYTMFNCFFIQETIIQYLSRLISPHTSSLGLLCPEHLSY